MTYLEKLVSTFDYFFAIFLVCNNIFRQKMIANLMVFRASIYRYCKYNQHVFVLLVFLKTVNLFFPQYRTADLRRWLVLESFPNPFWIIYSKLNCLIYNIISHFNDLILVWSAYFKVIFFYDFFGYTSTDSIYVALSLNLFY